MVTCTRPAVVFLLNTCAMGLVGAELDLRIRFCIMGKDGVGTVDIVVAVVSMCGGGKLGKRTQLYRHAGEL